MSIIILHGDNGLNLVISKEKQEVMKTEDIPPSLHTEAKALYKLQEQGIFAKMISEQEKFIDLSKGAK